jgi:hypothetical protein
MRTLLVLCVVLLSASMVIPVNAADHSIQWQNHCSYPIWVDIQGGLQYKSGGNTYGACSCLPGDTCNPNTMCNNTGCGPSLNKCNQGTPLVDGGGFKLDADLKPGAQIMHTSTVPANWQGAFWGRTGCSGTDDDLTCTWGTCRSNFDGKGKLQCGGVGITPPSTKGEINFDQGGFDTYDVSIVDGFNVPMAIEIVPGTGRTGSLPKDKAKYDCTLAGTKTDIRSLVSSTNLSYAKLAKVVNGEMVGIWSACAWASAPNPIDPRKNEYCCINPWGSKQDFAKNGNKKCDPTTWPADLQTAQFFKKYLPGSYSYAYDDDASTFQCKNAGADIATSYYVTFCGANEGERIYLPGSDEHTHVPVFNPDPVVMPTQTPVPTQTPAPIQTPVPAGRYNPGQSGQPNF